MVEQWENRLVEYWAALSVTMTVGKWAECSVFHWADLTERRSVGSTVTLMVGWLVQWLAGHLEKHLVVQSDYVRAVKSVDWKVL